MFDLLVALKRRERREKREKKRREREREREREERRERAKGVAAPEGREEVWRLKCLGLTGRRRTNTEALYSYILAFERERGDTRSSARAFLSLSFFLGGFLGRKNLKETGLQISESRCALRGQKRNVRASLEANNMYNRRAVLRLAEARKPPECL